jgi:uncharacterized sulfatase
MRFPALLVALCGALVFNVVAAARPNVIVILADDLGFGGLGCYGQTKYRTPHLDRMAAEGARLTQFNAPAPFCAPTRASLLTGRYPFRCGMVANPAPDGGDAAHRLHLPASEVLLPEVLRKAGYRTGMVGKWHLGHFEKRWLPTHRGFDDYFGIPYSNDMRPVALYEDDEQVEYPVIQANLTKRYTERALAFIEKNKRKPFFLYFAHAMPHKPLAASEAFYGKSSAGLYGDAMLELDWSVGQVLAKLQELKLDANTLVMFTSDNGAWFGGSTGGLRGMKGSSYEGGYRVPMIARWPGKIPAGQTIAEPGVMMDVFATTLAAANVPAPKGVYLDGRDLLPVLTAHAKSPHEMILGAQGPKLATVRDAQWKLHVVAPKDGFLALQKSAKPWVDPRAPDGVTILAQFEQSQPAEHPGLITGDAPKAMQLFDLTNDPGEQRDVAAQHPDVVARLKKLYDAVNRDVPAELPNPKRTGPFPK